MILYRPVGTEELRLIEESGNKKFPPRLPDQPIFFRSLMKNMLLRSRRSGMRFVIRIIKDMLLALRSMMLSKSK